MKNFFLFSMIMVMGSLSAASTIKGDKTFAGYAPKPIIQKEELKQPTYFESDLYIKSKDYNFWFEGKYLSWKFYEEDFQLVYPLGTFDGNLMFTKPLFFDFKYEPGFQIQAGVSLTEDYWNLFAVYTRYHIKKKFSYTFDESISESMKTSQYFVQINNEDKVYANFKFEFDMIDMLFSKKIDITKHFSFIPKNGLRIGFVDQYYEGNTLQRVTENIYKMKAITDSTLVGPKFGFSGHWSVCKWLRIYADLGLSVLYTHVKAKYYKDRLTNVSAPPTAYYDYNNKFMYIQTQIESAIGLNIIFKYDNDKKSIKLSAGYDFNHYLNKNLLTAADEDYLGDITSACYLYGWEFGAELTF